MTDRDTMTDRETLEKVAAGCRELVALRIEQQNTMAKLVRACLTRLKSSNGKARREALDALADLADMLEGRGSE